jgi:predicted dehydrogenase
MEPQTHLPKVSVALVGGGTIAPLHAEYLLSSPTCSLSAVIDPFPPGKTLATKLGVPYYDSIQSLLRSEIQSPDAYIICVPSSLHVHVATDVVTHGRPKAILIEKPFCTDSNAGKRLIEFAKSKSCQILVGHHRRFHPSIVAAREAIGNGKLGKITAITGTWTAKKPDIYYSSAQWRALRSAGGGPIWTNFIHDIDVLHYLTGSRVSRIWALSAVRHRENSTAPPADLVEEGVSIMLQFANGVVGTFVVSDNVPSPFGWEAATGDNPLYPVAPVAVDSYRIFGTLGTLTEPDGVLWGYDATDSERLGLEIGWNVPIRRNVLHVGDGIPFQQQVEHLARVIREGEKARCSEEDGLAAVKVCEAVITALIAGDGIPVDIHF